MKNYKIIVLLIVLTTIFIACQDEPLDPGFASQNSGEVIPDNFVDNFGQSINTSIIGRVYNEANQPIAGVTIAIGNQTVVTDSKGVFSVSSASAYEKFAYIKASKSGYIDASRSLSPSANKSMVEIMMLSMTPVATINSDEESTVALSNGTSILFDGNFVNQQGEAYSGTVDVVLKHLSPDDANINMQMPGMLLGERTDGSARALETYGMVAVELRGSDGNELQLANGSMAQIKLPLASNATNAPSTIPLWYFDEVAGYWKEEGQATLQGNEYVGEVSHFSFWNWDYPYPSVYLCVNLVNSDGDALSYTPVDMYSPTLNLVGSNGFTDNNGQVCGLVPRNEQMFLIVPDYTCQSNNFSELIGPFTSDQTITITVQDNNIVDSAFTAQFNDCDGNPLANGYIDITLNFNGESYVFPITDGEIALSAYYCSTNAGFSFQAVNLDTNQTSAIITGNFTNPNTDLGLINLCEDAPDEIIAIDDVMDGIEVTQSNGANAVINVLDNDTLNGEAINAEDVTISVFTDAFIINEDGTVDVLENTPTGEYSGEYQICETANPNNCATAVVYLYITNTDNNDATIIANDDSWEESITSISSTTNTTLNFNVLSNDTINGNAVSETDVIISVFTDAFGINDFGNIVVFENTPAGTYTSEYQICESTNPNNCSTALVTLIITDDNTQNPTIIANDDAMDGIEVTQSNGANAVINVLDNDTLNDEAITAADVTISVFTDAFIINEDGTVDVLENTPTGDYSGEYQICETANPNNCATAVVSLYITNTDNNDATIVAIDDAMDGIDGESTDYVQVLDVLSNDTYNGGVIDTSNPLVEITILESDFGDYFLFFTMDADFTDRGKIFKNQGTVPSGTYFATYQICEIANPNNCSTATVELIVVNNNSNNIIVTNNDTAVSVTGTLQNEIVLNVLDNDTVNNQDITTPLDFTITTNIQNDYFTIDDNGNVIMPLDFIPSGSYVFDYTICEVVSPNNCSTATVSIDVVNTVSANGITADNIDGTTTQTAMINMLDSDTINDEYITQSGFSYAVNVSTVSSDTDYFVLNSDGTVDQVIANAPSGTHTITYQLCENFTETPNSNCETNTIELIVN